ncbi:hypothetical protein [Pseudoalteromonas denitrificans]|jgi:hypothetical protein|uniref:Uncharacterized protein n=1 Tax=Pseudoalteromonas denitrificans DSM 6059 TaxID=1123010 RepID=A0A1I1SUY2_9GAMM|nr:hypothetical protein [Pseudoalteromonas denitrificans]SFD50152.1 hypothetical protein SAMN02745724_04694 [Pseudoalteromonas denitrificans DSM 6059]
MKLKLNKKKLKNLSKDNNALPAAMTPQVGGGTGTDGQSNVCTRSVGCETGDDCMFDYQLV